MRDTNSPAVPTATACRYATVFAFLAASSGCGLGQTTPPDGGEELPFACNALLAVTGTLEPANPDAPADECVPTGIWTLEVTVDPAEPSTCEDVDIAPRYTYEVTQDQDTLEYFYVYREDPQSETVFLKVNASGGFCRGNFEHWSADGTRLILLKPFEDNLVITGSGAYEVYSENQL